MNEALLSSKNLSWCTPLEFFNELDQEFHFNLDPAAPFPSAVIVWRSPDMAQNLRDMVLDLIKSEPMTANEIAATLSDRGQQVNRSDVGPILTKAQAAGKVRNAGKRACSVTGRSAIVWKAESEA